MACTIECRDKVGSVLDALFYAFWVEKKGVQLPETYDYYEPILRKVLGESLAQRVIKKVSTFHKIDIQETEVWLVASTNWKTQKRCYERILKVHGLRELAVCRGFQL